MARTTLSSRLRFDVFKRDAFMCQYCGASAPDVQLHVDHIIPVIDGGSDDLANLVTACAACNFGKGARALDGSGPPGLPDETALGDGGAGDDASGNFAPGEPGGPEDPSDSADDTLGTFTRGTFTSRREQTRAIEERRAQLAMMIEWREEVIGLQDEAIDALDRRIVMRTGLAMNEECRQRLRRWVRRYGLADMFDAVEDALDQMLEWQDGMVTIASWERAFAAVPRVAELRRSARDNPYFRELLHICGLLRRRLHYINELRCLQLMEDGMRAGASIESMKAFARTAKSWTAFRKGLEEFVKEYGRDHGGDHGGDYGGPDHDLRDEPAADRASGADRPQPAGGAMRAEGPLRPEAPPVPEAPFSKARPLRHFATNGPSGHTAQGNRDVAGTRARYGSGEPAERFDKDEHPRAGR